VCLHTHTHTHTHTGTEKGATPWAHQKAFMAALQQQMRSDGDADM